MTSPAAALSWQFWGRYRWVAAALLTATAVLALTARLPGAVERKSIWILCLVPLGFGLLFFLSAFAYPEGDVMGRASGFPAFQLTLPLSSAQLAFWPMLNGMLAAAGAWVLIAAFILRPLGAPAPLLWPACLSAAVLGLLQALFWSPQPLPYVRVVAALVALPALISAGVNQALAGVDPRAIAAEYLLLCLAAYGAAVRGIERARRGEVPAWGLSRPSAPGLSASREAAWSVERAQLWYEWRSHGLALPVAVTALCGLVSLPLLWVRDLVPIQPGGLGSGFGGIQVNAWLWTIQSAFLIPPFAAAVVGCGRRRLGRDGTLPSFLAARPIGEAGLVSARLKAAALSTLAAWAVMLAFGAAWASLPAREGERSAPLAVLLLGHGTGAAFLALLCTGLVLMFWTWKNQVQGMYADLAGRRWVTTGAPWAAHSLTLAGFLAYVNWVGSPRDMDLRYAPVPALVNGLLAAGVVAKLAAAAWIAHRLRKRGLVSTRSLASAAAAWGAAALGVFAALWWLASVGAGADPFSGQVVNSYLAFCGAGAPEAFHRPHYLGAAAVLFVPLTRLLAAPLALEWNRRR